MAYRMSRFEWLGQFFRPTMRRVAASARDKKEPRAEKQWLALVPSRGPLTVKSHTRSQAKAAFKRLLKVKHLPPGIEIRLV